MYYLLLSKYIEQNDYLACCDIIKKHKLDFNDVRFKEIFKKMLIYCDTEFIKIILDYIISFDVDIYNIFYNEIYYCLTNYTIDRGCEDECTDACYKNVILQYLDNDKIKSIIEYVIDDIENKYNNNQFMNIICFLNYNKQLFIKIIEKKNIPINKYLDVMIKLFYNNEINIDNIDYNKIIDIYITNNLLTKKLIFIEKLIKLNYFDKYKNQHLYNAIFNSGDYKIINVFVDNYHTLIENYITLYIDNVIFRTLDLIKHIHFLNYIIYMKYDTYIKKFCDVILQFNTIDAHIKEILELIYNDTIKNKYIYNLYKNIEDDNNKKQLELILIKNNKINIFNYICKKKKY